MIVKGRIKELSASVAQAPTFSSKPASAIQPHSRPREAILVPNVCKDVITTVAWSLNKLNLLF